MARHDTLAAVDLGSNSFHLQIGRVVDGQIYPLDAVREVLRLGAGLTAEKRIDRGTQAQALETLAKFAERLRGFSRQAVRAVGTNALRVAKNSPQFLREARQVLGFPIEVISGREEARSEEHTSELQSPCNLVCRLLLEKKKKETHVQIRAVSIGY